MDASEKEKQDKAADVKSSIKTDKKPEEQKTGEKTIPQHHTSQGHSAGAEGSATNSPEPTLRSATTDSSRSAKNSNDDLPEGGNIR